MRKRKTKIDRNFIVKELSKHTRSIDVAKHVRSFKDGSHSIDISQQFSNSQQKNLIHRTRQTIIQFKVIRIHEIIISTYTHTCYMCTRTHIYTYDTTYCVPTI